VNQSFPEIRLWFCIITTTTTSIIIHHHSSSSSLKDFKKITVRKMGPPLQRSAGLSEGGKILFVSFTFLSDKGDLTFHTGHSLSLLLNEKFQGTVLGLELEESGFQQGTFAIAKRRW
jgi:hypothetical protein